MEENVYLVYKTTHDTLKTESMLRDLMIKVRPVMKPVKIKSSCGMALEISKKHLPELERINAETNFPFAGVFEKKEKGWIKLGDS